MLIFDTVTRKTLEIRNEGNILRYFNGTREIYTAYISDDEAQGCINSANSDVEIITLKD